MSWLGLGYWRRESEGGRRPQAGRSRFRLRCGAIRKGWRMHWQRSSTSAPAADRLAVTMTGELCDCFRTKAEGVLHILAAVDAAWPMEEMSGVSCGWSACSTC